MSQCDAVLTRGVFDSIVVDFNRSVSDNILEWLKTVEYESFKNKISAGLNIGLPIEGIPVEVGANFSKEDFDEWKKAVDEGRVRHFTEDESLQIVRKTASPEILDAWVKCIGLINPVGTGIVCRLLSDEDAAIILYSVQFIPNSSIDANTIPKVTDFTVTGATSIQGIQIGDEIPFSGVVATITRDGRSEITINLDTDKGSCTKTIPAIVVEPPPPPIVNIAGIYKSQENNQYIFEQDGKLVTVKEVDPSGRVIASGAGEITGRTVNLNYQSFISQEKGTARITLSLDSQSLTGTYTGDNQGGIFALHWRRI